MIGRALRDEAYSRRLRDEPILLARPDLPDAQIPIDDELRASPRGRKRNSCPSEDAMISIILLVDMDPPAHEVARVGYCSAPRSSPALVCRPILIVSSVALIRATCPAVKKNMASSLT